MSNITKTIRTFLGCASLAALSLPVGCDEEPAADEQQPPMPYTEQLSKEALDSKGEQGTDLDRDREELRGLIDQLEQSQEASGARPPSTPSGGPTTQQMGQFQRDILGGGTPATRPAD